MKKIDTFTILRCRGTILRCRGQKECYLFTRRIRRSGDYMKTIQYIKIMCICMVFFVLLSFPPIFAETLDSSGIADTSGIKSLEDTAGKSDSTGKPDTTEKPDIAKKSDTTEKASSPTIPTVSNSNHPSDWVEPLTGMKFVWIPGGCFQMGSNSGSSNEKPVHKVCLNSFWMAAHEVTNRQFRLFKFCKNSGLYNSKSYHSKSYNTMLLNLNDQPAVHVSWDDAMALIDCLNHRGQGTFRLPTEAEWEYAARAGTTSDWFWGDDPGQACRYANVFDETGKIKGTFPWPNYPCNDNAPVTSPVGIFLPNPFGLYDMLGNVWEWCADTYAKDAYKHHSLNNPVYKRGDTLRIIRGGGWNNAPRIGRCASRSRNTPDFSSFYLGFRLVRDD